MYDAVSNGMCRLKLTSKLTVQSQQKACVSDSWLKLQNLTDLSWKLLTADTGLNISRITLCVCVCVLGWLLAESEIVCVQADT